MATAPGRPRPPMIFAVVVFLLGGVSAVAGVLMGPVREWSRASSVQAAPPTPRPAPPTYAGPVASGPSSSPAAGSPAPLASEVIPTWYPKSGPGTWRYLGTASPVWGRSGTLHRFQVAIESNLTGIDGDGFAAQIDRTLGDPQSWTAGGTVRLQRVPAGAAHEFTIYLATEQTSTKMCASGGAGDTGGYTSCRTQGKVIINLDRWYGSVPDYVKAGTPLSVYRTYVINHETGHELGHGHELCPASGRPAPVMEQQTLGLHGCTPNAWPYLSGKLYSGPAGSYNN